MEEIHDSKLNIAGERYSSFTEFYAVNRRRSLNTIYSEVGDRAAESLFSVDDMGTVFTPQDTYDALIYGSDLFAEEFDRAKTRAQGILRDKYEWLEQDRSSTDVTGSHVIVERYMMGHPESFRKQEKHPRLERSVHIIYDAMCAASVSVSKRIEAGCAVLAAAEALEKIGYKVAISFALARYSGNSMTGDPTLLLEILLKGYEGHLNIRKAQFALAAKSLLFHVGCFWSHRFPRTSMDYGEGEGYAVSYDRTRVARLQQYAENHHGVYLSQDLVDLHLQRDSARVLERIVNEIGAEDELASHEKTATMLSASVQPNQGRMFSRSQEEKPGSSPHGQSGKGARKNQMEKSDSQGAKPANDATEMTELPNEDASAKSANQREAQSASFDEDANSPSVSDGKGEDVPYRSRSSSGPSAEPNLSPLSQDEASSLSSSGRADAPHQESKSTFGSISAVRGSEDRYSSSNSPHKATGDDSRGKGATMPSGDSSSKAQDAAKDTLPNGEGGNGQDQSSSGNHDDIDRKSPEESGKSDGSGSSGDTASASDSGAGTDDSGGMSDDSNSEKSNNDEELEMEPQNVAGNEDDKFEIDTDELEDIEEDPFVVMLRKRFVRFESGEYLDQMINKKMAKRQAEKRLNNPVSVPAPPKANSAEAKQLEQGAPRCTPYGMTYRP